MEETHQARKHAQSPTVFQVLEAVQFCYLPLTDSLKGLPDKKDEIKDRSYPWNCLWNVSEFCSPFPLQPGVNHFNFLET